MLKRVRHVRSRWGIQSRKSEYLAAPSKCAKNREDRGIFTLETVCTNQSGEILIKGEAVVMILP